MDDGNKPTQEGKHRISKEKIKSDKIMAGIAGSMVLLVVPLPFILKHNSANSAPSISSFPTNTNTSSPSPTSSSSSTSKNTTTSNIHTLAPIPKKTVLSTKRNVAPTTTPTVAAPIKKQPIHSVAGVIPKEVGKNTNTTSVTNNSLGNDTNYAIPKDEKINYAVGSKGSRDGINYSIDANGAWTITGKFQNKDIVDTVQKTLKYPNGQIPDSLLCTISNIKLRCDAAAQMNLLNKAYNDVFHSNLHFTQGYRSLSEQYSVKASWTARGASYMAADPGTSNHGLGLAVDFAVPDGQSGTVQNTWLVNNSKNFGWVWPSYMRPGGSGPQESWHFQFNGYGIDGASLSSNSRSALRAQEKNKKSSNNATKSSPTPTSTLIKTPTTVSPTSSNSSTPVKKPSNSSNSHSPSSSNATDTTSASPTTTSSKSTTAPKATSTASASPLPTSGKGAVVVSK